MRKFTAIFWDNDGVLVDTEPLFFEATRSVFSDCYFELTPDIFREYFLQESRGAWHLLPEPFSHNTEITRLKTERDARYTELLRSSFRGEEHMYAMLAELAGYCRMSVVTSCKRSHFSIIHEQTGLLPLFDFVLVREDYRHAKPHPEPYLKAIERSGLSPEEILVIEDSERGLRAAKAAGLQCWVLPSELTEKSDFNSADRIIDSLEEVLMLFRGNNNV